MNQTIDCKDKLFSEQRKGKDWRFANFGPKEFGGFTPFNRFRGFQP